MDDLRLVGLSEDGSHLVLESPDGHRHSLTLDERLHAALRGDRARLGQLQIAIQGELRPRDIQARMRAGQSSEEIAAQAGLPVDRVARYEAPILLERVHTAELAQEVRVRRVTDAATTPLGDLVRGRLEEHGVAEDSLAWDSWRRDDGRWLVRLTYEAKSTPRAATWVFDLQRRTVEPADDEARWLTDEERAAPAPSRASAPPRLTAVPASEPDVEVAHHDTVPVRPTAVPAPAPEPVPTEAESAAEAAGGPAAEDDRPAEGDDADDAPAAEQPQRPARRPPAAAPARGRGSRRASVPSWDEILFGAPKGDPE